MPTDREIATALKEANRRIREDRYQLAMFLGVITTLAYTEFGFVVGLVVIAVVSFVSSFLSVAFADRWMRKKGLR